MENYPEVLSEHGAGFCSTLIGIYFILVFKTGSNGMPVLIMMAISLTVLSIMPGFFIPNLFSTNVGKSADSVFFTATSMIGMFALGGIVIRNSLVLIEFMQEAVAQGQNFKQATLESCVMRMRPILLTAKTTARGAFPITFDQIFSDLAWAFIFGLSTSTLFTLLITLVDYFAMYN